MPKLNKTGSTGPSRTLKNALNRLTLPLPLALSRSKLRGYETAAAIGYTKRLICRPRQAIFGIKRQATWGMPDQYHLTNKENHLV